MTMNRPRLIAVMLCGLIVLTLGYLLVTATAPSRYRAVRYPAVLADRAPVMAEPPPEIGRAHV